MQVKSIAECSKEHSAILSAFIKLPVVIKSLFLSGRFTQVFLMFWLRNKKMNFGFCTLFRAKWQSARLETEVLPV